MPYSSAYALGRIRIWAGSPPEEGRTAELPYRRRGSATCPTFRRVTCPSCTIPPLPGPSLALLTTRKIVKFGLHCEKLPSNSCLTFFWLYMRIVALKSSYVSLFLGCDILNKNSCSCMYLLQEPVTGIC